MIILIRSNDINPDPRLQKYIDYLMAVGESYLVLGWNREREVIEKPKHKYFHLEAAYGLNHLNIVNKLRWFLFIFSYLIKNKKKYHIVHACDFDTAFPVYLSKIFTKKKMIFDVFDWMSDSSNKGVIYFLIGILERRTFKKTDYAIICEQERRKQIPIVKENVLVMPNIPTNQFVEVPNIKKILTDQKMNYEMILSYVGVFDSDRGLDDLLEVIGENKKIFLNIAGFGNYESAIKEFSLKHDNIKLWGKVDYNKGLNIMKNSDLIIAMYYTKSPIHKYAAPNKYYEGLFLEVPIVTTMNTLVGDKTNRYQTGFSITEGKASLVELLENPNIKELINMKKINSHNLWFNKYENFISSFLENEYLPLIKEEESISI